MTLRLLGREVGGGAHDGSGLREVDGGVTGAGRLGDPEIGDLHLTRGGDEDVAGLHIAVNNPIAMGERERSGDVGRDFGRTVGMQRTFALDDLRKRATLDVLHDDEVGAELLAPVVDRHDVGMVQVRGGLRFASEPLDEGIVAGMFREENLHRDRSIEEEIAGQIDVGHATAGELAVQFVTIVEDCGSSRGVSHTATTLLST